MSRQLCRSRRSARGYTVVELLMATAVFAIGVTGIAAMQKITLASNLHAKRLALATHIAQSWIDRLAADASLWTPLTSGTPTNTVWVQLAGNSTSGWIRAPENADATFGPTFGPLGDYVPTSDLSQSYFCAQIRLTNMSSSGDQTLVGNGLVRTEVRVFWPRDGRDPNPDAHYCDGTEGAAIDANSDLDFHFVHKVSAVRQST